MRYYYSAESAHGSSSSYGFSNDTVVRVFNSKASRDEYVEESRNISCVAIKRDEATRHAANYDMINNNNGKPNTWIGEYYGIIEYLCDIVGQIGFIEVVNGDSDQHVIERFH